MLDSFVLLFYYTRYLTNRVQLLQLSHELDDEEAWLREKLLEASSSDYGRDLPSTQNLRKRHKRLEAEVSAHEPTIKHLSEITSTSEVATRDEDRRGRDLLASWRELTVLVEARGLRLDESLAYYKWLALIGEELAWLAESATLAEGGRECGETLSQAQAWIKKHEAFETDLSVHTDRVNSLVKKASLSHTHVCQ